MVPNKIYTDNRGVYAELPIFSQADANIEYIRKDALLEWAKDMNECGATLLAVDTLIDKLNEM